MIEQGFAQNRLQRRDSNSFAWSPLFSSSCVFRHPYTMNTRVMSSCIGAGKLGCAKPLRGMAPVKQLARPQRCIAAAAASRTRSNARLNGTRRPPKRSVSRWADEEDWGLSGMEHYQFHADSSRRHARPPLQPVSALAAPSTACSSSSPDWSTSLWMMSHALRHDWEPDPPDCHTAVGGQSAGADIISSSSSTSHSDAIGGHGAGTALVHGYSTTALDVQRAPAASTALVKCPSPSTTALMQFVPAECSLTKLELTTRHICADSQASSRAKSSSQASSARITSSDADCKSEDIQDHRAQQTSTPPSTSTIVGASGLSLPCSTHDTTVELKSVCMAASQTRGLRPYMEDFSFTGALHMQLGVQQGADTVDVSRAATQMAAAGVFDGHAGKWTADLAAQHTPQLLHMALTGGRPAAAGLPQVLSAPETALEPEAALPAALAGFDKWWGTRHGRDRSGSTAVVGLVKEQQLYVANIGDSAAVLARGGAAVRLSVDHRTDNMSELMRVMGAKGHLDYDPHGVLRVYRPTDVQHTNGCMFTRSLGDFSFKSPHPVLICEPHVSRQQLYPEDRLVLLSSDGVTDCLKDCDVLDVALRAIERARETTDDGQALAQAAATEVMIAALEAGSSDNVTAVAMLLDWQ